MKRYQILFVVLAVVVTLLAGSCAAVLSLYSPSLFWLLVILTILVALIAVIGAIRYRRLATCWIHQLVKKIDPSQQEALVAFPLPVLLLNSRGEVLFANQRFQSQVMDGEEATLATPIDQIFSELTISDLASKTAIEVHHASHLLTAYISAIETEDAPQYVLYLLDNTALKNIAAEYTASRPVALQICIDNLEEATEHLRAGDRARISGQVETLLEDWITASGGVLQKYGNERFLAMTEHRHLTEMTESRFGILDRVRSAFPEVEGGITLSIGVGEGKTIGECRRMARRALDMALSRGGDQVAIKTINGFDFYGGKSRGVERRTKVRTRIIADALRGVMLSSDRVLIMGHRLSDLDCLGSGAALAVAARNMGISAHVVTRQRTTMAGQLIERYERSEHNELFIEPDLAETLITKNTLLIVVDTHTVEMLDAPELYDLVDRVVVIDHHRRMVNYIKDAVLTYHEPSSSSACELVTELLQYLSNEKIARTEAEALLSGIMLDTRNFVLRTGVRTFEAAAHLRRFGADTVSVKKMFAESMDLYRYKSDLVSRAQVYRGTAISVTEEDYTGRRAAAAQAADDLLSVQGITASFVISPIGSEINISARSLGECNVQLVMESLGGGGHLTMAATQLSGITVAEAEQTLKAAIDRYFEEKALHN